MRAIVADTHALIWYTTADPRLSVAALAAFQQAEQQRSPIYVPTIVVIELRYLVEKKTITEQEFDAILGTLKSPVKSPTPAPLDLITAESASLPARRPSLLDVLFWGRVELRLAALRAEVIRCAVVLARACGLCGVDLHSTYDVVFHGASS